MSDAEIKSATLSSEDANTEANSVPVVKDFDPQARGWVKPTKYNYDAYNADIKGSAEVTARYGGVNESEEAIRATFGGVVPAWAAGAARYEWQEDYGDVAPRVPELEAELFSTEFRNQTGKNIAALEFAVHVESKEKISHITKFENAGLHPVVLDNVKLCGYSQPTPIQAYCIPAILTGHDLIAVAQTGSGKTAAFLIPILSKLMGKAKKLAAPRPNPANKFDLQANGITAEPLVLVVVPTRELAVQIFDEARRLCYRSMLRPCVAYGGGPVRDQQRELARGCDILIGTPGRLIDFMGRGKTLSLRRVKYTVIDEADEMVSNDWSTELTQLLSGGDNNEDADHRYMMFSATFPKAAEDLAKKHIDDDHFRIKVGRAGSTHKNIYQHFIFAENEKKRDCLRDLLRSCDPVRTIIFVNAKHTADEVDDFLYNQGFPSTSIHGDRTQREREDALYGFRTGKTPILVTTGVSARGLDVFDVGHVMNYDLPKVDHGGLDEYVHRIGRTARIGNVGVATSFYNDGDEGLARKIVKLLMESEQKIPDFLEEFKPEAGKELDFEEDENDGFVTGGDEGNNGGGWGEEEDATNSGGGGGWADETKTSTDNAWGTDAADTSAASAPANESW